MSLIGSLLAFVVFPLKARPPAPKPDDRVVSFALDFWRKTGWALMKEVESLREERDTLRAQLRSLASQQQALAAHYQTQQLAQHHGLAQQMLGSRPNQQSYQGIGQYADYLAAMQNKAVFDSCTCVPSRGEVLERRG
jgi:hypothetical protein